MYFLDCSGGISGDMLLSAFIDSLDDTGIGEVIQVLETAGGIMSPTKVATRIIDVLGTEARILDITFEHGDHHHHIKGLELRHHLETALEHLGLTSGKKYALKCLDTILEAECQVHSATLGEIHLHETGSPDTLVDLCGMAYIYEKLDLRKEEVRATSLSVGSGKVQIAHGLVDVPAPATRLILEGMKYEPGPVNDELATPTGVALLKNLIKGFVDSVPHETVLVGRGTGTKRFDEQGFINVLKLFRGNTDRQGTGVLRRDGAVPKGS
jgi:uncharacterized protein (DUF111 family)